MTYLTDILSLLTARLMNISIIQSMINAIDKPAIFITPDYVIQAVNQPYQEVYSTQVDIGVSRCHSVSHKSAVPCDQNGESCPIQSCIQSGRSASVVHIHQMENGKDICDIVMKPVKDEDGITIGFLEILEDLKFASAQSQKDKMVGESEPFLALLKKINRAGKSEIAVLLQGETGTGKELVAKALHEVSPRRDEPFVVIECTGLTESLFESELFGHEKGAFTGATHSKQGLIELANGGTVFFDEIGDVPLNMQVKLLRLLETRTYRTVGGLKQKTSNFRFLSASHNNLLEMVNKGEFRQDLYYRIAGFPIFLPSLSERKGDIALLTQYFLNHSQSQQKRFSPEALHLLLQYTYPGNIRELKNLVEQAVLLADEDEITSEDLPEYILFNPLDSKATKQLPQTLEQVEADYLYKMLNTQTYTIDELAAILGVSTRTLYRKIEKHKLSIDD